MFGEHFQMSVKFRPVAKHRRTYSTQGTSQIVIVLVHNYITFYREQQSELFSFKHFKNVKNKSE